MKSNNITLSEDAINKLEHNGFITTEDLQYSSPIEMDKDAKEEMNIKLADRKKLKKAMHILTGDNSTSAITLMGHTHCTKDTMSDNILNIKEGITLMGFTANEKHIKTHKNENLYIGNLHKLSDKTHLYSNDKTAHEWTMFISISNDKLIKPKSIKQVTYFLHPTFDRSIIIMKNSMFQFKRIGWGYFMIKAKIEFYEKYNRKNILCAHLLDFNHDMTVTHINEHNSMDIDNYDNEDKDIDCYSFYDESNVDIFHSDNNFNHKSH